MADNLTLQARLDQAEAALHDLTIGRRTKAFTHGAGDVSRRIEWTEATIPALKSYIADLRTQLGRPSRRRAIGISFR